MPLTPNLGSEAPESEITLFCWATKAPGAPKSKSLGNRIALAPFSITSSAPSAPSGGSDLLSNLTISICWPSTPPAALISLTASIAPLTVEASIGWNHPLNGMTKPILTVSAAWAVTAPKASPAASAAER